MDNVSGFLYEYSFNGAKFLHSSGKYNNVYSGTDIGAAATSLVRSSSFTSGISFRFTPTARATSGTTAACTWPSTCRIGPCRKQ